MDNSGIRTCKKAHVRQELTLGSLFSGSGGFELAGQLCGIKPIWKSEIEPFAVMVTHKHFPDVFHLGDICTITGAAIPPVDIITFGSPCQSFSVAGKREGLDGKSGLFYEAVHVVREMRTATNNTYPRFAVMENVPGIFSSKTNGNSDFLEVLNELCKIKDETHVIPMPESTKGKWTTAGEIVGDGFSLAWRTIDAQFFGVAQRRRRCYLVIDFDGECAGQILFDESRLRGDFAQGGFPWQGTACGVEGSTGTTSEAVKVLNDQGGSFMSVSEDVTATLRAEEHGHQPIVFEPGAASRVGGHAWHGEPTGALRADMGDNRMAVAIPLENHPADSRIKIEESGTVQTLTERMGTGGGNVPLIMDGTPTAFGLVSKSSNSWKSNNPHSGCYEADTSRTLDTSVPDPNKNGGGMAVVALEGNGSRPSHRGNGYRQNIAYTLNTVEVGTVAYSEDTTYSMTCGSFTQVCEEKAPTLMSRDYKDAPIVNDTFGNNGYGKWDRNPATLKANGGDYPGGENMVVETCPNILEETRYIVRRLTPQECALLQGFPSDFCSDLGIAEPTEEDIAFWAAVWETHRRVMGKSEKPKSRTQLIKWLKNPHTDGAEYRLWGNGIALPCCVFVLGGIAALTPSHSI